MATNLKLDEDDLEILEFIAESKAMESARVAADGKRDRFQEIADKVPGLDLFQPRDWPHREGDRIDSFLHLDQSIFDYPLGVEQSADRSHPCDLCGTGVESIGGNILCWKCKGAFCEPCGQKHTEYDQHTMESLLKIGFTNCMMCEEPLRSIGLPASLRRSFEANCGASMVKDDFGFETKHLAYLARNSSLVEEADEAFSTAKKHEKKNETEEAILEYTHAINAVNMYASSSKGIQLVLRARDILIASHLLRAKLEGNSELVTSIETAFPRASVRDPIKGEASFALSRSAYQSLFYSLPAKYLAGSPYANYLLCDQRCRGKEDAMRQKDFCQQVTMLSLPWNMVYKVSESSPDIDGNDDFHFDLNGTWKGLCKYECVMKAEPCVAVGTKKIRVLSMIHLVWVFPTEREATDFLRACIENDHLMESKDFQPSSKLAKDVKERSKNLGAKQLGKIHVRTATLFAMKMHMAFAMAVVGNVVTKVFVATAGETKDWMEIACKALAHLERKLLASRSEKGEPLKEAFHTPDLTLCAYCGEGSKKLLACGRCQLARYCSADCQKKHYCMPGPHAHKHLCKAFVAANGGNNNNNNKQSR